MKNAKFILLFIGVTLIACILQSGMVNAQRFSYSVRTAFVKMDMRGYGYSHEVVLFPEEYSNGYEIGALVTYRFKPSPLSLSTGLNYSFLKYDNSYSSSYNLNFLNAPLLFNIEGGKKAGVLLGFGCRFWYLLKIPYDLEYYHNGNINRFLFSWTGHLGAFFTIKKLRFQIYPQIEYFRTPLYINQGYRRVEHYINIVTYNLTVSF